MIFQKKQATRHVTSSPVGSGRICAKGRPEIIKAIKFGEGRPLAKRSLLYFVLLLARSNRQGRNERVMDGDADKSKRDAREEESDDILADHEIPHISKRKITYSTIKSSPFLSQRTPSFHASLCFENNCRLFLCFPFRVAFVASTVNTNLFLSIIILN